MDPKVKVELRKAAKLLAERSKNVSLACAKMVQEREAEMTPEIRALFENVDKLACVVERFGNRLEVILD